MPTPRPFHLALTTPPASEPVTLAETKLFLRVDGTEEDVLLGNLIATVRMAAEQYVKRSLITQTWTLTYDDYAPAETRLLMGPVQAVNSVTRIARDGSTTTVDDVTYYLSASREILLFDATPFGHRVAIEYDAGYGAASEVPSPIKQGMLAHMAAMYHQRALSQEIPEASKALYAPYRVVML